jgi:hypothetical protein
MRGREIHEGRDNIETYVSEAQTEKKLGAKKKEAGRIPPPG